MEFEFTIFATVTFYSGKRREPPCLHNEKYRPHLMVKGDSEYLGVSFLNGSECRFDEAVNATVLPLYEGVGYDKLALGTPFFILEGGKMVGEGVVREILRINC